MYIGNVEEMFPAAFQREILLTCQGSHYSSMLHVMALANVVGTSVRCVYPLVSKNVMRPLLNCLVVPSSNEANKSEEVSVMWSSTRMPRVGMTSQWSPNHFVPLVPKSTERASGRGQAAHKKPAPQTAEKPRQLTIGDFLLGGLRKMTANRPISSASSSVCSDSPAASLNLKKSSGDSIAIDTLPDQTMYVSSEDRTLQSVESTSSLPKRVKYTDKADCFDKLLKQDFDVVVVAAHLVL